MIINDGFSTVIVFPGANVVFKEKEVTPPGVDGGGENDTTTMRNLAWRTRQPKKLKTLEKLTLKVAWDSAAYVSIVAEVNTNQVVRVIFPDNTILEFWGWLNKFMPDPMKEGEQPTAEIEIICSNQNDAGAEVAPALV